MERLMTYWGASLIEMYILPTYSPKRPIANNIKLPANNTISSFIFVNRTISNICPKKTLRIIDIKQSKMPITPKIVAMRKGFTENAVNPFIQRSSSFLKEYPDFPDSLFGLSRFTFAIFLVTLSISPCTNG